MEMPWPQALRFRAAAADAERERLLAHAIAHRVALADGEAWLRWVRKMQQA